MNYLNLLNYTKLMFIHLTNNKRRKMNTKRIIELVQKMSEESHRKINLGIELKALSEKDPEFVEKLEAFLNHCREERKR